MACANVIAGQLYPSANITSIYDWFCYSNAVTNGYFGDTLLALIFIIAFISMRAQPKQAFPTSFFITALIGLPLALANLVSITIIFVLFGIAILSAAMFSFKD